MAGFDFEDDDLDLDLQDGDEVTEELSRPLPAGRQEAAEEEEEQPVKPATATPAEKDGEPEIEIVKDELYAKKPWKEDPSKLTEDPNDKDYGKQVQKRIGKLKAANSELARREARHLAEKQEMATAFQAQQKKLADLEKLVSTGTVKTMEKEAEAHDRTADLAIKKHRDALVAGDPDAAANALAELTQARVASDRLKNAAESKKSEVPVERTEQAAPTQRQAPAAPVERINWFRKNAWFNGNGGDELSDHAIRVHRALINKGVEGDTPEYFAAIDKQMRAKFPQEFGVAQRAQAKPVTPPTQRQAPQQASPIQGNKIVLTQAQVNAAAQLGLTSPKQLKAYALELAALGKGN